MMDEAETQLKDQITDLDLKQVGQFYHAFMCNQTGIVLREI